MCPACGKHYTVMRYQDNDYCSIECSVAGHREVAMQMVAKAGPAYERAARGQLAYWASEVERLGLLEGADGSGRAR